MRAGQNKKILLVEDEALIAMSEKMQLEGLGYNVQVTYSGEQSIELFNNDNSIDLILMDIDLGQGIDGVAAGRVILERKDVPLVFLSSHTEQDVVLKTEEITSYGYVVKNTGLTVLDASIQMAFKLFDAHRRMHESQLCYRSIFENGHTAMLIFDPETVSIVDANQAAVDFYGWPHHELAGRKLSEINMQSAEVINKQSSFLKDDKRKIFETEHRIRSGDIKNVEVRTGPIDISGKAFILFIVIDRTPVKIAELLQKESEAKYHAVLNTVNEAVYMFDVETFLITEANDSACKLYGYELDEMIGLENFKLSAEPEAAKNVSEEFKDSLHFKRYIRNRVHRKKDGTIFSVLVSSGQYRINDRRFVISAVEEIKPG